MPLRACSTPGCPTLHQKGGRCPGCAREADRGRRPNGNPYATRGHLNFRETVLTRDPICVLCLTRQATVADHWPTERRDLVDAGENPNDPKFGRGLCTTCHNRHTAATSPGGWHDPATGGTP